MNRSIPKLNRATRVILIISCVAVLAGCSAPSRYLQVSERSRKIEQLASDGKCEEAIKSYGNLKKEFTDQPYSIINLATSTTGRKSFAECLIENGRAEEVIKNFELVCLSNKSSLTAQQQTYICKDYKLKYAVAPAYKMVNRENPFEKNPGQLDLIEKNSEYMSQIDAAIGNIYKRNVTQTAGTSAETLRYYKQMRVSAIESITLLDKQIPKCQGENNGLCLKFLAEKRQDKASDLKKWNNYIKESEEDFESAEAIAQAAPAILNAISSAGSRYAASNEMNRKGAAATSNSSPAATSPAATPSRTPYGNDTATATSSYTGTRSETSAPQTGQSQRRPYKANANSCISLRGNQIVNTCSKMVWVTFCVTDPRQTKNFFDSSDAFKCPNGGLENISGNRANGLIWHGWVHYFACYADDIGTMKTNFWQDRYGGSYHGLCGGYGADGRQDGGASAFAK